VVADELVEFFEGPFVEEEMDAFPSGQLAVGVLAGLALRATSGEGGGLAAAKFVEAGGHGVRVALGAAEVFDC